MSADDDAPTPEELREADALARSLDGDAERAGPGGRHVGGASAATRSGVADTCPRSQPGRGGPASGRSVATMATLALVVDVAAAGRGGDGCRRVDATSPPVRFRGASAPLRRFTGRAGGSCARRPRRPGPAGQGDAQSPARPVSSPGGGRSMNRTGLLLMVVLAAGCQRRPAEDGAWADTLARQHAQADQLLDDGDWQGAQQNMQAMVDRRPSRFPERCCKTRALGWRGWHWPPAILPWPRAKRRPDWRWARATISIRPTC